MSPFPFVHCPLHPPSLPPSRGFIDCQASSNHTVPHDVTAKQLSGGQTRQRGIWAMSCINTPRPLQYAKVCIRPRGSATMHCWGTLTAAGIVQQQGIHQASSVREARRLLRVSGGVMPPGAQGYLLDTKSWPSLVRLVPRVLKAVLNLAAPQKAASSGARSRASPLSILCLAPSCLVRDGRTRDP